MLTTSACSNRIPFWSPYHRIKLIIVCNLGPGKDLVRTSAKFVSHPPSQSGSLQLLGLLEHSDTQLHCVSSWICELGRIDIIVEVTMSSRCLAVPRWGHLDQVFHVFTELNLP